MCLCIIIIIIICHQRTNISINEISLLLHSFFSHFFEFWSVSTFVCLQWSSKYTAPLGPRRLGQEKNPISVPFPISIKNSIRVHKWDLVCAGMSHNAFPLLKSGKKRLHYLRNIENGQDCRPVMEFQWKYSGHLLVISWTSFDWISITSCRTSGKALLRGNQEPQVDKSN